MATTGSNQNDVAYTFEVSDPDVGKRIDQFFSAALGAEASISRTRIKSLIERGDAVEQTPNGARKISDSAYRVKPGARYTLTVPAPEPLELKPQSMPLDIAYEDEHLIVVNKPAGLVVHPAPGNRDKTLVNALMAHCGASLSGIGGVSRPGIVHRLDKGTSGLMVAAKNDQAHVHLAEQFSSHGRDGRLQRRYHAFVWGRPRPPKGRIEGMIGRSRSNRKKMAVVNKNGKVAVTHYRTLSSFGPEHTVAYAEFHLETGRTHQIRVHSSHIGHSVVGDPLYGHSPALQKALKSSELGRNILAEIKDLGRPALHAQTLGFEHPISRKKLTFSAPLPKDLMTLAKKLEQL